MKHRDIINQIKNLDYSSYPYKKLKELLKEFGTLGIMVTTLHKEKQILRARINENNQRFLTISDLSYKPQDCNTTYQRASTPFTTMFYGSIVPEILGKDEPQTARVTIIFEISDFARSFETIGEQIITFSVWEVQQNINLISLIFHQNFKKPTALSLKLQQEYNKYIKTKPELELSSIEINRFLGEEYAKDPIFNDYEYMISAIYSEISTDLGFDGVLYPSVKLGGEGINIALTPNAVNTKLKFLSAGEDTIYKNKEKICLGNDTHSIINSKGTLEYYKAPPYVYVSKEIGRKEVGLE